MAYWTSQATVKKHLQASARPSANIFNERIVLNGVAYSNLYHTNVDTGTEDVKIMELNVPHPDTNNPITLNGVIQFNLQKNYLAWSTLVVASDLALTTLYVENLDYIINYTSGKIERTPGSAIADGGTVYVWYLYYQRQIKDTDYEINNDNGQIKRILAAGIPDGATCFVDYSHSEATVTDVIIDQAILESEAWMLERLKPTYDDTSADQGLKSAATYFSLAIIMLSQAIKETSLSLSESSALSQRMMQLAVDYDGMGVRYFQTFSGNVTPSSGGLIQNRNRGPGHARSIVSPSIAARRRKR